MGGNEFPPLGIGSHFHREFVSRRFIFLILLVLFRFCFFCRKSFISLKIIYGHKSSPKIYKYCIFISNYIKFTLKRESVLVSERVSVCVIERVSVHVLCVCERECVYMCVSVC
jgi:hypothetical protein